MHLCSIGSPLDVFVLVTISLTGCVFRHGLCVVRLLVMQQFCHVIMSGIQHGSNGCWINRMLEIRMADRSRMLWVDSGPSRDGVLARSPVHSNVLPSSSDRFARAVSVFWDFGVGVEVGCSWLILDRVGTECWPEARFTVTCCRLQAADSIERCPEADLIKACPSRKGTGKDLVSVPNGSDTAHHRCGHNRIRAG
jgi:hypothetical protein